MTSSDIWAAQRQAQYKKSKWHKVQCVHCTGDMWVLDDHPDVYHKGPNNHGKWICKACNADSRATMEAAMKRVNQRKKKIIGRLASEGQRGKHGRHGGT